jgi:hypothetical protein
MKKIIAGSVLSLLLASPAIAQDTNTTQPANPSATTSTTTGSQIVGGQYYTEVDKNDFLASKLMGARVYATTVEVDADKVVNKASEEWNDVGQINNLVVGKDGQVKGVVIGVGGFLGIGEKDVAVPMDALKFVRKGNETSEDWFIVVKGSKESLEQAPTYKRTAS